MALNETLWQFPVDYSLKVMGRTDSELQQQLVAILTKHMGSFDTNCLKSRPSRAGRYVAYTAQIYLTEKRQVEGIYADLHACEAVLWAI